MSNDGVRTEQDRPSRQTELEALADIRGMLERVEQNGERTLERVDLLSHEMGHVKTHLTHQALELAEVRGIQEETARALTILVVEDDLSLLDVCCRVLRKLGFAPLGASTKGEALNLIAQHGAFDAALVDLRIPESLDGVELCRWITRLYPATAVVIMSGRLEAPGVESLRAARLCKPFTLDTLRRTLLEAMGDDIGSRSTERPPAPAVHAASPPLAPLPPAPFALEPTTLQSVEDEEPDTVTDTPEARAAAGDG